MNLLQMSFSGAAFITAVVIIRALAINKLPKKTFLVLWELVILRLLIPFSIPSMFSVYTLVTHSISSTTLPEAGTDYNIPTMQALSSLPEKKREIIYLYFFGRYTQQEIGELYGRCRSTAWHHIHSALQMLHEEMEVLSHE